MPTTTTVTCPSCGKPISLDQALTHQFQESLKAEILSKTADQTATRIKEAEAAVRSESLARHKAESEEITRQLRLLEIDQVDKNRQLREMAAHELKLRQEKNQLEERERQLALEVQRQVDAEKLVLRTAITKELEEITHFQTAQKEKQIDDLRRQLTEAQRVASQGSQQSQGEVVELELENLLKRLCPLDIIEPVSKGINGADIIHRVCDRRGVICGTIVWELKNTKAWSIGWIAKLKEDQRREKAEIAVLISSVLPEGIKAFGLVDGIWVGSIACVGGLSSVLRSGLLEIAGARTQGENKQEKIEFLYQYLTGVAFCQRVQSVIEAYVELRSGLQTEKRAYAKIWAAREKQLDRAEQGMIGMWGDLEGLMGSALPKIDLLELEATLLEEAT